MNTYAVQITHKTECMPASGFYYYHLDCWDADHQDDPGVPRVSELGEDPTPIHQGTLRLVALADIAMNATCCGCWKTLHSADEIIQAEPSFRFK